MLEGVFGGRLEGPTSINSPLSARSTLFPTRRSVRFGEASARASFIKEGSEEKVLWDVISYTSIAPAAPR
jgi:hypothetical protein